MIDPKNIDKHTYWSVVKDGRIVALYNSKEKAKIHIKHAKQIIADVLGITEKTASQYINNKNIMRTSLQDVECYKKHKNI